MDNQPESLKGWKVLWADNSGLLSSPSHHHDWRPREAMTAHCGYAHDLRDMPYEKCSCGIYSVKKLEDAWPYLPVHQQKPKDPYYTEADLNQTGAFVELSLWGKYVIEGDRGWRSEKAYPRMIIAPTYAQGKFDMVRDYYEVPVIYNDEPFVDPKNKSSNMQQLIDLSHFTAEQIRRALRQKRRHALYMKIRNEEKTINQLRHSLASLPRIIAEKEERVRRLKAEREAL